MIVSLAHDGGRRLFTVATAPTYIGCIGSVGHVFPSA